MAVSLPTYYLLHHHITPPQPSAARCDAVGDQRAEEASWCQCREPTTSVSDRTSRASCESGLEGAVSSSVYLCARRRRRAWERGSGQRARARVAHLEVAADERDRIRVLAAAPAALPATPHAAGDYTSAATPRETHAKGAVSTPLGHVHHAGKAFSA